MAGRVVDTGLPANLAEYSITARLAKSRTARAASVAGLATSSLDGDSSAPNAAWSTSNSSFPASPKPTWNHKVVLVNAWGMGAGDDKLVFLWVPDMIKAYLGEEAILEQARSYDLRSAENRQYVLQNLDSLVLKTRQGYGGLGVVHHA